MLWWGVDRHFLRDVPTLVFWGVVGCVASHQCSSRSMTQREAGQGPGSRLVNDFSDLELKWGRCMSQGE